MRKGDIFWSLIAITNFVFFIRGIILMDKGLIILGTIGAVSSVFVIQTILKNLEADRRKE